MGNTPASPCNHILHIDRVACCRMSKIDFSIVLILVHIIVVLAE